MQNRQNKTFSKTACGVLTVLLLLFGICAAAPAVCADTATDLANVDITAPHAAVYCTETGTFLYEKDADTTIYPASTTKILTAIVALETAEDLDMEVTVSENAVYGIDPSSSHIALEPGEKLTLRQILYGLLLASGNDCAVVVAESLGGSIDGYAALMNAKAAEIGCENSHFSNPHGLFGEDHFTTVHDLCLIMAYAAQNETFVEIDSTLVYSIPKTNKQDQRELWNGHGMLENKWAYYEPVICGKTGYITESGFNLVTYAEKNGVHLIVTVAGEPDQLSTWNDTRALMEYVFNNYALSSVTVPEDASDSITIDEDTVIPTRVEPEEFAVLLPAGRDSIAISYDTVPRENLQRPIAAGDPVGELNIYAGETYLGTRSVFSTEDFSDRAQIVKNILHFALIGAGLLAALVLLLACIVRIRKQKRRRRRQSR